VRQLALLQLAVEGQPLRVQLGRQHIELGIDRLPQERDVHLREHGGFSSSETNSSEKTVLQAVVEVEFTRLEALPDLAVQPELVAVGMQARRRAIGIEGQQVRPQAFRQRGRRTFGERPLRQALLLGERPWPSSAASHGLSGSVPAKSSATYSGRRWRRMRSARPSTACQCKASLLTGFTLMRCAVVCSVSRGMIL
jgi:hypothetical protein